VTERDEEGDHTSWDRDDGYLKEATSVWTGSEAVEKFVDESVA
jgi:hypothetical protein